MTDNLLAGEDNTPIDENKNYLEELVGDGKKFKSPEDLAKGKYISDNYIKTLETRLDEMRKDHLELLKERQTAGKLEELIDKINKSQREPTLTDDDDNSVVPTKAFDPKEIESLVSSKIQEHEATKRQQENFQAVEAKLRERYGDNYKSVLKQNMDNLGLTEDFVNDLARKHPQVFYKTFGIDTQPQKQNFQTPTTSNNRSNNFAPTTNKRTWSYYQQLKKENPRLYYDPKTNVQMHNDAMELGEAFQDGDWDVLSRL